MKDCGIYRILNKNNCKSYIGSTLNFARRKLEHFQNLKNKKHPNLKLQNAYNKHQETSFLFETIAYCSEELLLTYEQQFLDFYKPEYNMSMIAGRIEMTQEVRAKIGAAKKGKPRISPSLETRAKIGAANKTKHRTVESRLKLSLANKGKKLSLETRAKIGANSTRRKLTENDILYIRASANTVKELTIKFGVHRDTVYDIRARRTWKHLL